MKQQPEFRSEKKNGLIIIIFMFDLLTDFSINLFPLVEIEVVCAMVAIPSKA